MANSKMVDLCSMGVSSVMSQRVASIRIDDSIHEALEEMVDQNFSALPVVNHAGVCVGLLSRTDLADFFLKLDRQAARADFVRGLEMDDGYSIKVRELMVHDPITVSGDDPVQEAARLMAHHRIHHLPVLDREGILIGIISSLDIARCVAEGVG
ncbi:MAG TPA: CBS domain-containing protein [Pirellulaceae bacterium]|nr:CBS domain-containing protein [Pirellulaceae bacterium]